MTPQPTILALGMPGMTEWLIIGAIGLLLFGKRLPEVGKGLGRSIVEFKKGLADIKEEVRQVDPEVTPPPKALPNPAQAEPEHRFDPYTGQPVARGTAAAATPTPAEPAAAPDSGNPATPAAPASPPTEH